MAHEMTDNDQMFSVRIAPWHMGTGTNVTLLPDHPSKEQVLEYAGLDWTVDTQDVYRQLVREGQPDSYLELPGWKMLVRSDTQDILHVAKDSYEVLDNHVGAELFELLLGEANVKFETGGSTRNGAVCYLTAKVDEDLTINGDDSPTFPYLVVTWAHNGTAAMVARATNVRVVCQNTISASEAEAERTGRQFTFRHTKNVKARIEDAKEALRGARDDAKVFQELANELAKVTVTKEQKEDFVTRLLPAPATDVVISERVVNNITDARDSVRALFTGPTIPDAHKDTAYGLLLAGTEYLDHLRGARNSDTYLGRTLLKDSRYKARLVPMIREVVAA
jgi:phage/plasmid-like protein (TIGR03299 family)